MTSPSLPPDRFTQSGTTARSVDDYLAAIQSADGMFDAKVPEAPSPSTSLHPASKGRQATIASILSVVPAADRQVAGTAVPAILDAAHAKGITDPRQIAYMMATAEHESDFGANMSETPRTKEGQEHPVQYFDHKYSGRSDLGNRPGTDDGYVYRGRGYVQITGRTNYEKFSNDAGADLLAHPDRATDPRVAAKIMVDGMSDGTFTGAKMSTFINSRQTDFREARRVVNGADQADFIAGRTEMYLRAINGVREP